ncbi:MAG: hypothetical protein RMJ35_12030, partial [Phycisphaerales bacterium]|nr:hypothetical protein [Phycisphaerales bacterium]
IGPSPTTITLSIKDLPFPSPEIIEFTVGPDHTARSPACNISPETVAPVCTSAPAAASLVRT